MFKKLFGYLGIVFLSIVQLAGCATSSYDEPDGYRPRTYENTIFTIESYTIPEEYEKVTLYAATVDVDEIFYTAAEEYHLSCPGIVVFCHEENTDEPSMLDSVWFPKYVGGELSAFYIISRSEDGQITVRDSAMFGNNLDFLMSLAAQTSQENPLYLVADNDFTYALVGDTVYGINNYIPQPELPALYGADDVEIVSINW